MDLSSLSLHDALPIFLRSRDSALRSAAGAADGIGDVLERGLGVAAQGRDGADADDDDQGQHDRVLDGGRAVVDVDALDQTLGGLTHGSLLVFRAVWTM